MRERESEMEGWFLPAQQGFILDQVQPFSLWLNAPERCLAPEPAAAASVVGRAVPASAHKHSR